MDVLEHPDISCALLTGHPLSVREPRVIRCEYCEKEMSGDDEAFDYDGDFICECCFLEQLQNDLCLMKSGFSKEGTNGKT